MCQPVSLHVNPRRDPLARWPENLGKSPSYSWLVVEPYPSEKYEFVSWDDEIPDIWKNNPNVPVTTNQIVDFPILLSIYSGFPRHVWLPKSTVTPPVFFQNAPLPGLSLAPSERYAGDTTSWINYQSVPVFLPGVKTWFLMIEPFEDYNHNLWLLNKLNPYFGAAGVLSKLWLPSGKLT